MPQASRVSKPAERAPGKQAWQSLPCRLFIEIRADQRQGQDRSAAQDATPAQQARRMLPD